MSTFIAQHQRHAHRPLRCSPVLPHINVEYLIRDIKDSHRSIHSQRIGQYIKYLKYLLTQPTGSLAIEGKSCWRHLGCVGWYFRGRLISNWSSRAIFDNFYSLLTLTSTDLSSLTLATSEVASKALEPQYLDPRDEV